MVPRINTDETHSEDYNLPSKLLDGGFLKTLVSPQVEFRLYTYQFKKIQFGKYVDTLLNGDNNSKKPAYLADFNIFQSFQN